MSDFNSSSDTWRARSLELCPKGFYIGKDMISDKEAIRGLLLYCQYLEDKVSDLERWRHAEFVGKGMR